MIATLLRFLLVNLLVFTLPAAEKEALKILFIGNSYTGVNQLPNIFKEIALSGGHAAPVIKSSTPGGRNLEQHVSIKGTQALIDEGGWDVVVLQGHSQEASIEREPDNVRESFFRSGKQLCDAILSKSPQARIVWYQTWARHADYWNAKNPDLAIGNSPEEMMARNRKSYDAQAAKQPNSIVARVGDAWEAYYKTHPGKDLHTGDNSHPTFTGSYLAALVIYQTIYRQPTLKVAYRGNLSEDLAAELQKTAAAVAKP